MSIPKNSLMLAAFLGSATLLRGAPALAQSGEQAATLEEVIVTAQKRAENVQDVPIAIDALSRDTILAQRMNGADDLVRMLPNLSLKQASAINSGFAIRGVGTPNFHLTALQSVGMYFDEISQVTPFTSQLGLFDMERIEVLRGPQNTLFGLNTTGGAVNFISHRPDAEEGTNGYVNVNIGTFDRFDGEGAVGFALGDTFSMRLAGQVQIREGVFRDVDTRERIGSTNRKSARLGFAWDPNESTNAVLSFHYADSDPKRIPRKATGRFAADNVTMCPANNDGAAQFEDVTDCYARDKSGALFNPSLPNWREAHDAAGNEASVKNFGGYLKFEHDLGPVSLVSLTGYDDVAQHLADESGGLPYVQFQAQQEGFYRTFTQELRLASSGDGRAKWIGGVFYSHDNDHFDTTARNNAVGPPTRAVVPSVILNQKVDDYSAYAKLDLKIAERFNMDVGVRWTEDKKSGNRIAIAMFDTDDGQITGNRLPEDFVYGRDFVLAHENSFTALCAPGVSPCAGPWEKVSQDYSNTAGKLGFDYHFTDDVMAYASYSTGFKSGSFDTRAQAVLLGTGDIPVKPEELAAYEIGLKSQWLDRRMKLNLAAFYYDWKDLQTFATVPGIGPAFLNLPKSTLIGQELEWQFAPGADWVFRVSGAHLDTEVTDVGTLGPDAAIEGAPLPFSPEWTYNAGISKGFSIGDQKLTLNASTRHASEQWGTMTRRANTLIKSSTFVDFQATYAFDPDNRLSVTAWGENLTSEKTCLLLGDIDGFTWTNACQPNEGTAMYGVSFRARF